MKVLVCGGREFADQEWLNALLDWVHYRKAISLIVHGAARGADSLAREWALSRHVDAIDYPAEWHKYGKRAGPVRNQQMLDEQRPFLILAFPGGTGTRDMITRGKDQGVFTYDLSLPTPRAFQRSFLLPAPVPTP